MRTQSGRCMRGLAMRNSRSTGKPTAAQQRRFDRMKDPDPDTGVGCLVAHILGFKFIPAAVHHLTIGGHHGQKRRGHDFTIALNDWSHQGRPLSEYGWDADECRLRLGPSFAIEPNAFRETFGSDDELLALQNELLGL